MSVHTSLGLAGSRAARADFLGSTRHWFRKRLYRLISLQSTLGKGLGRVIAKRLAYEAVEIGVCHE